MINYRVDDMAGLTEKLRNSGLKILKGPDSHENGKFAWSMDPDGNPATASCFTKGIRSWR